MTHHRSIPRTLVVAVLIAGATATPALADDTARRAEVELVETSKDVTKTIAFTLAVVDDGASSSISSRLADGYYQIKVRRSTEGKPKRSVTWVELERHDGKGPDSLSVHAMTTAAIGKRAVLLEVDRGDGTKYEVAVTVR
jgi:cobalamin-dependent methionine synthase I